MGLKTNIENAFFKSMFPDKEPTTLTDDEKGNIPQLAQDLTDAFKTFLSKQTWQITDMQAFVELDNFRVEEALPADVEPDTLIGPYGPVLKAIKSLTGIDLMEPIRKIAQKVSAEGAKLRPLDLDKQKSLKATGHAYIGNPSNSPALFDEFDTKGDNEGWNQYAKVKINIHDMEEDE